MSEKQLSGKTALVTGASSGIGEALARDLARRGADLILLARREDRLRALAETLSKEHGVKAEVLARDLTAPGMPTQLATELKGRAIDVLVNNAGYGVHGTFLELDWEKQRHMLELDVICLLHLTHLFVPPMVQRGWGRVLQVASIGAFQPSPTYAVYAAAKSLVLNFGEAFNHELEGTGVRCTVVCPGVTESEFAQVAGQKENRLMKISSMPAAPVAEAAVKAMLKGKSVVVPGFFNAFTAWLARLMPRSTSTAMAAQAMK